MKERKNKKDAPFDNYKSRKQLISHLINTEQSKTSRTEVQV